MILTCPQCATRYQADAAKFQPSGRNVRCAKCGHVWHQDAPPQEAEAASDIAVVDETSPPAAEPSEPVARPAAFVPNPAVPRMRFAMVEPPRSRWPAQLMLGAGWAGLVAIVLVVGWSALTFRQQIATLWPQSASLYAALGMKANATGLDIQDVSYRRSTEAGQPVLTVTGDLANAGTRELPVPQIRVALIDDDHRELYHWTFVPGVTTLRPGQSTKFLTRPDQSTCGRASVRTALREGGRVSVAPEILFSEAEIAKRVVGLAKEIAPLKPDIAVPILVGAFVFAADLLRALAHEGLSLPMEFLWLRSYEAQNAREISIIAGPTERVRGKSVLLIDGVLDCGTTILKARTLLKEAGAKSIITAVAVDKLRPDATTHSDFALFQGVSDFIIGYGMDEDGRDRGLPYIASVG